MSQIKEESKETGGFVAEDSKGDSVPFGTRLSPGKSSVLYLYPKAGSKTAACAPLKHRLPFLRCDGKRSLPGGSGRLNGTKGIVK